jgi:hypothetical protein
MRLLSILCCAAFGILAFSLAGCSSNGPDAATAEANKKALDLESNRKVNSTEELKKTLTKMAETGEGGSGSGLAGLRTSIENVRSSNPAVADALLQDLAALQNAKGNDEVKSIAAQMAARL